MPSDRPDAGAESVQRTNLPVWRTHPRRWRTFADLSAASAKLGRSAPHAHRRRPWGPRAQASIRRRRRRALALPFSQASSVSASLRPADCGLDALSAEATSPLTWRRRSAALIRYSVGRDTRRGKGDMSAFQTGFSRAGMAGHPLLAVSVACNYLNSDDDDARNQN
jgi:hypothetical protein